MQNPLENLVASVAFFLPETVLAFLFFLVLIVGLVNGSFQLLRITTMIGFASSAILLMVQDANARHILFNGLLGTDGLSWYVRLLIDVAAILTVILSFKKENEHPSEYFSLLTAIVFGAHLLTSTTNFLMIFISIELISIPSFILAGFAFTKKGVEGSLKYFMFGVASSATMLYGFSLLYGLGGKMDFADPHFLSALIDNHSGVFLLAGIMALLGFLYKIAAVPMHLWAPDVYEPAPIPVLAFLSVVPKVAGIIVLLRFSWALGLIDPSSNWQKIFALIALITITVGNLAALKQSNVKRMMAYSSIAHSGFLLIGIVAFSPSGIHFLLFYATIYMAMNFLVFVYLDHFEKENRSTFESFSGTGKSHLFALVCLLVALISLTGLPPTGGFMAKLFIFSALWQGFEISGQKILLLLLIFGLANSVISLFYYLKIPYFAFFKSSDTIPKQNIPWGTNLFGIILVLVVIVLFFFPSLLMGWINKINFAL